MLRAFPFRLVVAVVAAAALISAVHLNAAEGTGKPERIVSINLCVDEMVLRLAERRNIASVTWLARNPDSSTVVDLADGIPINHGVAEEVLPFNPDIVIAGIYTARPTVDLLRRIGVRTIDMDVARSFDMVRQQYHDLAAVIGEPEKGERLMAEMDRDLDRLASGRPSIRARAIVLHGNTFTNGRGSLADEVLTRAGLTNVAADLGVGEYGQIPLETIVTNEVDVLILSSSLDWPPAIATEILRHPALAKLPNQPRVVVMPTRLWNCGGPPLVEAVDRLTAVARELAGKAAPRK